MGSTNMDMPALRKELGVLTLGDIRETLIAGHEETQQYLPVYPSMGFSEYCTALRHNYKRYMDEYEESSSNYGKPLGWNYDNPYHVCPFEHLSPIEKSAWEAIKSGNNDFVPHFPVGKYVLDFANPHFMIGIECDGKQWHNAEKDAVRDRWFADKGWLIFRLEGRKCHYAMDYIYNVIDAEYSSELSDHETEYVRKFMNRTVEGLMISIRHKIIGNQRHDFIEHNCPGLMLDVLVDNLCPTQDAQCLWKHMSAEGKAWN